MKQVDGLHSLQKGREVQIILDTTDPAYRNAAAAKVVLSHARVNKCTSMYVNVRQLTVEENAD